MRNASQGAAFTTDDKGHYGIQLYDNTGESFNWTIDGFDVEARGIPVYVAGGRDVTIQNGRAWGQVDVADTTIPKAGIVINGTIRAKVKNVYLHTNTRAHLAINGPSVAVDANHLIENVITDASATQGLRIRMQASVTLTGVTLRDCRFSGATYGGTIWHDPDEVLRRLVIQNCYFSGATYGLDAFILSGAANDSGDWLIEDTEFATATGAGFRVRNLNNPLILRRCKAYLAGSAVCFEARTCLNAKFEELDAEAGAGGKTYEFTGATGIVRGLRFNSTVSTAIAGLGAAKPTHSGKKGDEVQNVNFTVAPVGAGQTYEGGWLCEGGTVWRAQVRTVNAA